jgi:hypothetical protein
LMLRGRGRRWDGTLGGAMRSVWRFLFIDSDVKSRYEKEGLFERRSVFFEGS